MKNHLHQRELLKIFVGVALPHIDLLPPVHRADALDGLSIACERHLKAVSKGAAKTAQAIRDAEQKQLSFQFLIKESIKPQPPTDA